MLGFIGGNGVAATNKLLQLVEERCIKNGAFRDCHHPEMIVWQATQAPSRSMYLEGRGPSFIEEYIRIGLLLKNCGCTEICIGCNTAHYAFDEISKAVGLPFINVIDEVAKYISALHYKQAIIMCTDGCRKTNLYDKSFSVYAPDVKILYPTEEGQKLVTKGICNAKNLNRYNDISSEEHPYNIFNKLVLELESNVNNKSECCIVGGCTDIRNVYIRKTEPNSCGYVDSLEVLADVIYSKYNNIK